MGRKDLLEAFRELEAKRRAGADEATPSPRPAHTPASPSSRSAPPQPAPRPPASVTPPPPATSPAPDRTPVEPRPQPDLTGAVDRSSAPFFRPFAQPIVLAALLLAFALGFLVGRDRPADVSADGGGVGASAPSTGGGPASRASLGAGGGDGSAAAAEVYETEVDRALYDRANRYTVLAITYDTNSARNRELAAATVASFRDRGLPAARPQPSGAALVVVVGAAPTQDGLFDLRDRVQQQPGPSGRAGEFSTAGIYAIDNLIER